jgi:predicted NUDIX family NTP pyrophosphohydrolase
MSSGVNRMSRSKISAGLLMFRRAHDALEVLLAHPGGLFYRNKDAGVWTIPKGESEGRELRECARKEFEEEIGLAPPSQKWIELGSIKQKGGKTVHAWAVEGDLPGNFQVKSNIFAMEWPPHSGKIQEFPEIDQAKFFALAEAKQKINPAQIPLLDRLRDALGGT